MNIQIKTGSNISSVLQTTLNIPEAFTEIVKNSIQNGCTTCKIEALNPNDENKKDLIVISDNGFGFSDLKDDSGMNDFDKYFVFGNSYHKDFEGSINLGHMGIGGKIANDKLSEKNNIHWSIETKNLEGKCFIVDYQPGMTEFLDDYQPQLKEIHISDSSIKSEHGTIIKIHNTSKTIIEKGLDFEAIEKEINSFFGVFLYELKNKGKEINIILNGKSLKFKHDLPGAKIPNFEDYFTYEISKFDTYNSLNNITCGHPENKIQPIFTKGGEITQFETVYGCSPTGQCLASQDAADEGYSEEEGVDITEIINDEYGDICFEEDSEIWCSYKDPITMNLPSSILLDQNLSRSGKLELGMVVYIAEKSQAYQFVIDNHEILYDSAKESKCVTSTTFNTSISNKTAAGSSFIDAWTIHKVEGEPNGSGGVWTRDEANWKKYSDDLYETKIGSINYNMSMISDKNSYENYPIQDLNIVSFVKIGSFDLSDKQRLDDAIKTISQELSTTISKDSILKEFRNLIGYISCEDLSTEKDESGLISKDLSHHRLVEDHPVAKSFLDQVYYTIIKWLTIYLMERKKSKSSSLDFLSKEISSFVAESFVGLLDELLFSSDFELEDKKEEDLPYDISVSVKAVLSQENKNLFEIEKKEDKPERWQDKQISKEKKDKYIAYEIITFPENEKHLISKQDPFHNFKVLINDENQKFNFFKEKKDAEHISMLISEILIKEVFIKKFVNPEQHLIDSKISEFYESFLTNIRRIIINKVYK